MTRKAVRDRRALEAEWRCTDGSESYYGWVISQLLTARSQLDERGAIRRTFSRSRKEAR
jgi:phage protein U